MLSVLLIVKFPVARSYLEAAFRNISESAVFCAQENLNRAVESFSDKKFDICAMDIHSIGGWTPDLITNVMSLWPGSKKVFFDLDYDHYACLWARNGGAHAYISWTSPAERIQQSLLAVVDGEHSFPDISQMAQAGGLLTPRQVLVLKELERGASNKEIAKTLGMAPGTVKIHVNAILKILGVQNRTEAALYFQGGRSACSRCSLCNNFLKQPT